MLGGTPGEDPRDRGTLAEKTRFYRTGRRKGRTKEFLGLYFFSLVIGLALLATYDLIPDIHSLWPNLNS